MKKRAILAITLLLALSINVVLFAVPNSSKTTDINTAVETVKFTSSSERHEDIEAAMLVYVNKLRAEDKYAFPMNIHDKTLQHNCDLRVLELEENGLTKHNSSNEKYSYILSKDLYCKCENTGIFTINGSQLTVDEWAKVIVDEMAKELGCMVGAHNVYGLTVNSNNDTIYVAWQFANQ